jgi:hypothetical protein
MKHQVRIILDKFYVNHVAFFLYYVFGSGVGGGC